MLIFIGGLICTPCTLPGGDVLGQAGRKKKKKRVTGGMWWVSD